MTTKKARRSDPEIERCAVDAHRKGVAIDDLDYDEVTGLMDVIAKRSRAVAEQGTAKIRELAARIDATKVGT